MIAREVCWATRETVNDLTDSDNDNDYETWKVNNEWIQNAIVFFIHFHILLTKKEILNPRWVVATPGPTWSHSLINVLL